MPAHCSGTAADVTSHPPAMCQQSRETAGFELVDFGWELNHLLRCILLRGKWLCHLCPPDFATVPPGDLINYAQTHKQDSSTGHTA